ncbi:hypothetical protein PISL3812_02979 [Talaromyces islandicus]|uniref:Uncharacterized protein n=1 Tax=Talaromyces islandicus TaxID=28573 RepID=A0A0U1LT71_TALIS|nr:hypothetical protein PISL3812_02979 [Talaromyces islandicus]
MVSNDSQYLDSHRYCHIGKTDDVKMIFHKLSQHLPAEEERSELLKDADTTGATLAHDVASKTRKYIQVFEPWAELHISTGDHGSYYREDIVQNLRCQASLAVIEPEQVTANQSELYQTIQLYDTYRSFVQNLGEQLFPWTSPYFPSHLSLYAQTENGGRGIVYTAGDGQVSYILTSIATLRMLGCRLPIEVMYQGDNDLRLTNRRKIESFPGVVTRNLEHMINLANGWRFEGFDMKPFAVLASSFREVILMDADVGFLKNPEILFQDVGYLETGTLFFYDRVHDTNDARNEWVQKAMPNPLSTKLDEQLNLSEVLRATREDQESGVVLFNKAKHFIPLLMICWLNGPERHGLKEVPGIDGKGFYDTFYGDKDTFWFGMELAGTSNYAFSTGALAAIGNITKIHEYTNDQNLLDAVIVDEYAYNTSDTTDRPNQQDPHHGRTVISLDRDVRFCSYQMLHMDRDQSPLWYNGWISDQKKSILTKKNLWQFEHYMVEAKETNGKNPWTWAANYKGCLNGRELVRLTHSEKEIFNRAIQAAVDFGLVKEE